MTDFFISYAQPDSAWALWIAWELEEQGYEVIVQERDFTPGSNFGYNMQEALTRAGRVIAVLSPDYVGRRFPQAEWLATFATDPTGQERKLIPIRITNFDPPGLLRTIVYIDLANLDEAAARTTLVDKIRSAISGESPLLSRPSFPGTGHRVSRPACFPGNDLRIEALHGGSRSRFVHTKLTADGILDIGALTNPYADLYDPTDYQIEHDSSVHMFIWFPRTEVLRQRRERFTPAAAICTLEPQRTFQTLQGLLTPEQMTALDIPPRRLRPEEKNFLFSAIGTALRDCFVLVVTLPDLVLGVERSKPEVAYQAMIDLFFLPLLGVHRRLGIERASARFFKVGDKDNYILKTAKRSAKGCYVRRDCVDVGFTGSDHGSEALGKVARLLAWAVGHYYNHDDQKWLAKIEAALDGKGSSRLEEPRRE